MDLKPLCVCVCVCVCVGLLEMCGAGTNPIKVRVSHDNIPGILRDLKRWLEEKMSTIPERSPPLLPPSAIRMAKFSADKNFGRQKCSAENIFGQKHFRPKTFLAKTFFGRNAFRPKYFTAVKCFGGDNFRSKISPSASPKAEAMGGSRGGRSPPPPVRPSVRKSVLGIPSLGIPYGLVQVSSIGSRPEPCGASILQMCRLPV